jgi:hypothetical protein
MRKIKIENTTQLAALIGIMRDKLRSNPTLGQSLREIERSGNLWDTTTHNIKFTLGVARTGYVSLNYGLDTPSLMTAKEWRAEADNLNIGPVT